MRSNKVTLVTPFRGATIDLAEILQDQSRLAALYTGYPRFKMRNTRVRPDLLKTCPWLMAPYMAATRWAGCPPYILRQLEWYAREVIESYALATLPECGLVEAMSSVGLRVGIEAKRRGNVFVLERGSTHIMMQENLLRQDYEQLGIPWQGFDPRVIDKELKEYALADAIMLSSRFSIRSFLEMGIPQQKLKYAPYGVNLSTYRRTAPRAPEFRILFCGQPIVRKGLHYLLQAVARAKLPGAKLVMVGPDSTEKNGLLARYPVEHLEIIGFVSRDRVIQEMSRASVLVLPSIEDGFGLVIAQALACGCPVIATNHTGAEDVFQNGKQGFIISPRDVDALANRLTQLYSDPALLQEMGDASLKCVGELGGWDEYGRNVVGIFDNLLAEIP